MRTGYEALSFSHDEDDHSLVMPLLLLLFTPVVAYLLPSKWYRLLAFLLLASLFVILGYDAGWLLGASLLLVVCVVGALVWGNAWHADQFLRYAAYFVIAVLVAIYIDYLRYPKQWELREALRAIDRKYAGISQERRRRLQELVRLTIDEGLHLEFALQKIEFSKPPVQGEKDRAYLRELKHLYKEKRGKEE